MDDIVFPTAKAMVSEGIPFRGVLFAGLMIKHGKVGGWLGGGMGEQQGGGGGSLAAAACAGGVVC